MGRGVRVVLFRKAMNGVPIVLVFAEIGSSRSL